MVTRTTIEERLIVKEVKLKRYCSGKYNFIHM